MPLSQRSHRTHPCVRFVVGIAALIASGAVFGGCRTSGPAEVAAHPEAGARSGIGGPCRHDNDCIAGAECQYGTCDFREPCTVTRAELATGRTTVEQHRFDADGRGVAVEEKAGDVITRRDETTWHADGHVAVTRSWFDRPERDEPDQITVITRDPRGLITTVESTGDEYVSTRTYTWSTDWACPAPSIDSVSGDTRTEIRAVCDADGHIAEFRESENGGEPFTSKVYTWSGGRMASITRYLPGAPAHISPLVRRYQRDARGSVIGVEQDNGADGTVDFTERYDTSCWRVEGDRVRYVAGP